jgi:hypothetical protein
MPNGQMLVTHPDGREQAIPIGCGALRLGSAHDNDLVMAGPGITQRHATIRCDDQGDLLITIGGQDARTSSLSLRPDSASLEIELPRAFAPAALLRIGGYVLRYQPADRPDTHASRCQAHTDERHNSGASARADDEISLLRELLDQRIVWADDTPDHVTSHEAATIEMPALVGRGLSD